MFQGNDRDTATTAFVSPGASGLDRLWRACVAAESEPLRADTLRDYLRAHRLLWDMPSLAEVFPEIVEHLEARYVAHRHAASIEVFTVADHGWETFAGDDMRGVVDILLSREYREAMLRERVLPSWDRLVG